MGFSKLTNKNLHMCAWVLNSGKLRIRLHRIQCSQLSLLAYIQVKAWHCTKSWRYPPHSEIGWRWHHTVRWLFFSRCTEVGQSRGEDGWMASVTGCRRFETVKWRLTMQWHKSLKATSRVTQSKPRPKSHCQLQHDLKTDVHRCCELFWLICKESKELLVFRCAIRAAWKSAAVTAAV